MKATLIVSPTLKVPRSGELSKNQRTVAGATMFRWGMVIMFALTGTFAAATASAQSFSVDGHFNFVEWSEYYYPNKATREHELFHDLGAGAHVTWRLSAVVGIEADTSFYAQGPGDQNLPGRRFEGLFGATVGPRLKNFRPFAKALVGFVNIAPHRGANNCVSNSPPYLTCELLQGATLPAYDLGGGFELTFSPRVFLRMDGSVRSLKYPGPVYARDGELKPAPFWGSAPRLTGGVGFGF